MGAINIYKQALGLQIKLGKVKLWKYQKNVLKQINSQLGVVSNKYYIDWKNPYWYHFTHFECPICGARAVYKKRMYTPKPLKYEDRHRFEIDTGCGCIY